MSLTWIRMHHYSHYALWWISEITLTILYHSITFLLQKHKETILVTRPTRRLRGCVFIWLLLAKAFDKEHLKRTSPHPNSVQSKVLLQIFSVSLAPKIHFTWFMCQAPTKYSKSPQLSSQGAFCMLNYVGKTGFCRYHAEDKSSGIQHVPMHQASVNQCRQPVGVLSRFPSSECGLCVEHGVGVAPRPSGKKTRNTPMIHPEYPWISPWEGSKVWKVQIGLGLLLSLLSLVICSISIYFLLRSGLWHGFGKASMRAEEGAVWDDLNWTRDGKLRGLAPLQGTQHDWSRQSHHVVSSSAVCIMCLIILVSLIMLDL